VGGRVEEGDVFLCESCKVCVNEIVKFVGQRGGIVVDVTCGVHGVKRGGGRSVREEDRHHRQVLVTVELSFVLCKNDNPVQLLVHVCEVR
jgi:hypothetical protein